MTQQLASVVGEELGLGDHVAFFFKSNAERLAFVIPYILNGLRNLERCVYIADENTVPAILAEFKDAGIDIDTATTSGALSVVTKHDTYLRHGMFEPERMITDLDRDVRFALQSGFSGLRVTGEMSWALDLPSALSRLCEYEQELCRRWPAQLGGSANTMNRSSRVMWSQEWRTATALSCATELLSVTTFTGKETGLRPRSSRILERQQCLPQSKVRIHPNRCAHMGCAQR